MVVLNKTHHLATCTCEYTAHQVHLNRYLFNLVLSLLHQRTCGFAVCEVSRFAYLYAVRIQITLEQMGHYQNVVDCNNGGKSSERGGKINIKHYFSVLVLE